jgi:hypothetical protein
MKRGAQTMIINNVGFIVLDDYTDPLRLDHCRIYDDREDAMEEARNRLRQILQSEQRSEECDELTKTLEACGEVCITEISSGWQGDIALIRLITAVK